MVQTRTAAVPAPTVGADPLGSRPGPEVDPLDHLEDVVFRTDADGRWTYLNQAWTELTGFGVQESLGTRFLDYVHPDEREHTVALFMAVVEGAADRCHHETRYRTRDGDYRWVQLRSRLLRDADGAPLANVGTLADVTERRQAGEAVREHEALLELGARGAEYDDLPVGSIVYAPDLTVRRASPVVRRLLGAAAEPGAPVVRVLDLLASLGGGSELHGEWGLLAAARRTRRPQYGTVRLAGATGGRRADFHVSVLPLPPEEAREDGQEWGVAMVLHDVTDLRRGEQQHAAVARLGQRALSAVELDDLLDEAVHVVADTLEVTHCAVLELLPGGDGLLARAAVGWPHTARDLGRVPVDPGDPALARPLANGVPVSVSDLDAHPAGKAAAWAQAAGLRACVTVVVHGGENGPFGVLVALSGQSRAFRPDEVDFLQAVAHVVASAVERRRAEEGMRHQALHDPLTGLANRILLRDRLDQALRARRRSGGGVALLLLDLDRFKEINDTLGHDAGDDVLRVVAGRLVDATREGDTVVRLGGDEFAVVMPAPASIDEALVVADKVRAAVAEPVQLGEVPLRVDASVGIAVAPAHGKDPGALLKRADVAMYSAKALPSGLAVYSSDSDENRPEHLVYSAALREAIAGHQLLLHYQPKVDLVTSRVGAVEVLVRWAHPSGRLVPPDQFIPLAERTGLIGPLTWRVLAMALDQARAWHAAGRPWSVAVNISARTLHDPQLVDRVLEQLDRVGLPPSVLELELTESAVMSSPSGARAVVRRLREAGVRLSLDDFGTGYSSLAYLRDLPVHELKIDRSFLRDIARSAHDASIVRTVIDLGHTLDLRVVGEGIEDQRSCTLLRELGCDEGQGFFLARPAPAADLPADIGHSC